ncbi:Na+/proline symporter [Rivularia sp. PCC 7116]|uniref:sodium/proline symporter n=1 Tax=Rivularia sp. PCC 7116 TaxID=373994 RepID=UPI00029F0876|nr:sodium/proline symporter [Rivularia sp. PCC 7116]AFY57014.1 Na+/proline symporter [Rivularia sp. PCC 7116]
MNNKIGITIAFIFFSLSFTFVGILSAKHKTNTTEDYLLASRNVNPWLTALSAMSTGQSGLLFTGQVGYAYMKGISAIWLVIGWAIGDYLAWWWVFRKLRLVSEDTNSETVSDFLSQEKSGFPWIKLITALIIIAFLASYAAAQLVASSKTLHTVFGWNYSLGAIVGAVIVVIYCFSGGIRADIWTDAIQSVVMIVSLILLLVTLLAHGGGIDNIWTQLQGIDSNLVQVFPSNLAWGFTAFFMGWLAAGFGAIGQPHILTRAMAIDSADNIGFARNFKTVCGLVTSFSAIFIGLAGRVFLPQLATGGDPELALLYLSADLLPPVLVGLMLAGLFAAIVSTADSQILCCSAALTQDIFPGIAKSHKFAMLGTLTITAIVLIIALSEHQSVFSLTIFAWSALAAGLGPLLVIRALQKPVDTPVALAMIFAGTATVLIWNLGLNLSSALYEVLPGMAAGFLVYALAWLFYRKLRR